MLFYIGSEEGCFGDFLIQYQACIRIIVTLKYILKTIACLHTLEFCEGSHTIARLVMSHIFTRIECIIKIVRMMMNLWLSQHKYLWELEKLDGRRFDFENLVHVSVVTEEIVLRIKILKWPVCFLCEKRFSLDYG